MDGELGVDTGSDAWDCWWSLAWIGGLMVRRMGVRGNVVGLLCCCKVRGVVVVSCLLVGWEADELMKFLVDRRWGGV